MTFAPARAFTSRIATFLPGGEVKVFRGSVHEFHYRVLPKKRSGGPPSQIMYPVPSLIDVFLLASSLSPTTTLRAASVCQWVVFP